jgi:hypothetical protein|tara:strand:+ start:14874 stop:15392 length:519 start_codon:yes stop_codon:yes gene_type:complete
MKLLIFFLLTLISISSVAGVLMDVPTALKQNFGDYEIRKEKVFLTGSVIKELERVSKAKFESKIYSVYEARSNGIRIMSGILETHLLRSRTQTLFIVFDNKGRVVSTQVLAFYEPEEYVMSPKWLAQFKSKTINDKMQPGDDLIKVSGATISYNETASAIRRMTTLYNYIYN